MTSIEIPNSVTSIGNGAFYGCSGFTSIEIPNSVTSIGERAFADCSGFTSIEIPNSVTSIGDYTFAWCSGLKSIEIPNSVTNIGNYAFYYCSGLTSIEIPNSVTSIGERVFYNCSGLKSVTIGNSVTSIGDYAFGFCVDLTSVTNLATTPQPLSSNVFYNYGTLHVLKGYKDVYSTAGCWMYFTIVDDAKDPTGIEEIKINATDEASSASTEFSTGEGKDLYNLQGVKVNGVKKGSIYVRNGRKFIAK